MVNLCQPTESVLRHAVFSSRHGTGKANRWIALSPSSNTGCADNLQPEVRRKGKREHAMPCPAMLRPAMLPCNAMPCYATAEESRAERNDRVRDGGLILNGPVSQ